MHLRQETAPTRAGVLRQAPEGRAEDMAALVSLLQTRVAPRAPMDARLPAAGAPRWGDSDSLRTAMRSRSVGALSV